MQKDEKSWKNLEKCEKMHLNGNGSPKYRKQSTRRGCPTATDAPDTIFKTKLMKNVDSWRSENSEKTNARRRVLQKYGLKTSIEKGREMALLYIFLM